EPANSAPLFLALPDALPILLAVSPLSAYVVTPAPTVPTWLNAPAPSARSILKLVSLVELLVHVNVMAVLDVAVALNPLGAAGAESDVVAVAVLEYAESPPLL